MSKKSSNPAVALSSGAVAGGIEALCVWPTENIKTQLQLQGKVADPKFTSFSGGVRYVVRTQGALGLYTGLVPILIGSLPKAGIRFGGNTFFKGELLKMDLPIPKTIVNLLGGVCAGICEAIFAVTPMETVKTKTIQMNCGFVEGMKRILAEDGLGGLYKGVTATIMKQSSNQGLRFMFMGNYRDWITNDGVKADSGSPVLSSFQSLPAPIQSLFGGMGAGCFSTLGNNPFDVVKTKMQGIDASKFSGTADCFMKTLRNEGLGGLYSGCIPRLYRVVPGQGIIFMSYDYIEPVVSSAIEGKKSK